MSGTDQDAFTDHHVSELLGDILDAEMDLRGVSAQLLVRGAPRAALSRQAARLREGIEAAEERLQRYSDKYAELIGSES